MNQEKKKRILVVEDNDNNLYLIRFLLESNNCEVLVAKDGERGVALAKSEKPDLILMDIQLPKMDGYAATRAIKGDPAISAIPVVVLTSFAMPEDQKKAEEAGCDEYIAKPINPDEVMKVIKKFFESRDALQRE